MEINIDKIIKYDKPGPRYTSYPTAPHFHEGFTQEDYIREIQAVNKNDPQGNASLYFHLPFCDTLCYFCGCNMIVTHNRERIATYIKYLKREIDMMKGLIGPGQRAAQLHWGGGTPTHLNPDEILDVATYIQKSFNFREDSENGCEIDPRGLTREHLVALRNGGFNRISMGVQDFDPKVQEATNRIQPEDMTRQVVQWVRELKFESINLDLMYGLPHQHIGQYEKTVDTIIDIAPDRIAVFNYAHLPWLKKHMALIKDEDLPKPEEKLAILKMTIEKLTDAGYVFIGMDHFAKPDDELAVALREKKLHRNFQGYSTRAGSDIYAMGITSISQIGSVYAQNYKQEKEYYQALDEGKLPVFKGFRMNKDDMLRRHVIMKIMCDFSLEFKPVEEQFGINFREYFKYGLSQMQEFIDDGLLILERDRLEVTEEGRLFIRNIAMYFDGYIERKQDKMRYSRTV